MFILEFPTIKRSNTIEVILNLNLVILIIFEDSLFDVFWSRERKPYGKYASYALGFIDELSSINVGWNY